MVGAGKTTLAKQLEPRHNAIRLCPDEWIKLLIKNENDKEELDRLREPVEQLQWSIAQKLLHQGVNVILENGFWSKEERMAYRELAKKIAADVELHYLHVPKEELWRRIQKRNIDPQDHSFRVTLEELEKWIGWFSPPDASELTMYDDYVEHKS